MHIWYRNVKKKQVEIETRQTELPEEESGAQADTLREKMSYYILILGVFRLARDESYINECAYI